MEGLIPFVIDAIRKSHGGGGSSYRRVSSDGSSHGGSGSWRHLIDYWELPAGAAVDAEGSSSSSSSAMHHRSERSEFVQATAAGRRAEEHALHSRAPAAVVAGSAYRRK